MASNGKVVFEDFFPVTMENLGTDSFMKELGNVFDLLMDGEMGVITFASLKRNAVLLGLEGTSDDEIRAMLREGDLVGFGALNKEFYTLMFRLSPDLMRSSEELLEEQMAIDSDDDQDDDVAEDDDIDDEDDD